MPKPEIVVLGEIRAPRLGILTVVQNTAADMWQIQLRRDNGLAGALMTIAIVDGKITHRKHVDFEEQRDATTIVTTPTN